MNNSESFTNFSGVFGLYERAELREKGSAGFADKNFGVKNNTDFSYATASGTKGFTAVAILTLVAEGRLKLDDCVKPILLGSSKITNGESRSDLVGETGNSQKYGDTSQKYGTLLLVLYCSGKCQEMQEKNSLDDNLFI